MRKEYEGSGITLYCGDSAEVLDLFDKNEFDLVLTDPPYGLGKWNTSGGQSLKDHEAEKINQWDAGEVTTAIDKMLTKAPRAIVWGGNYLMDQLGACRAPLVWDKGIRGMHFADGEMAWTNLPGTLRILPYSLAGSEVKGKRKHPTQKPKKVFDWCLDHKHCEGVKSILDPFCGSGTSLIVARQRKLTAVGIEKDPEYCELIVSRLEKDIRQEVMF